MNPRPASHEKPTSSDVYAVVLGITQDAGLPHAGCRCLRCATAYADPTLAEYAAALAIVDASQSPISVWLIDATPDIREQLHALHQLAPDCPLDGIALTQAVPGPIVTLVAFVGFAVAGVPGAVAATAGIYLPSFAAVLLVKFFQHTPVFCETLNPTTLK